MRRTVALRGARRDRRREKAPAGRPKVRLLAARLVDGGLVERAARLVGVRLALRRADRDRLSLRRLDDGDLDLVLAEALLHAVLSPVDDDRGPGLELGTQHEVGQRVFDV